MSSSEPIAFGIVGATGRGGDFALPLLESDEATVAAVCDVFEEGLNEVKREYEADESYRDNHEMLWEAEIDAVVVATPKQHHVAQVTAALERDLHVLCEVPAAASLGECRDLVRAVERSEGTFMLAENFVYRKDVSLVQSLVEAGLFGEVHYAVGERVGEETGKLERTKWRRTWRGGRNGITYPTHTLGPVLSWLPDDRIARLTCAGSGHHHVDPRGEEYGQEDTTVLLGETERGRLVRLRQDLFSPSPPHKYTFQLQGTEGSYESARTEGNPDRIWLEEYHGEAADGRRWHELAELECEHLPERWRDVPERVREFGHGGADYFVVIDFVECLVSGDDSSIGIHDAMDMTLPGILSERAIADEQRWVDVPDSRDW